MCAPRAHIPREGVTNRHRAAPSPGMCARGAHIPTSPHPNSGLPEFGTISWPKSDISDLGWGEVNRDCLNVSEHAYKSREMNSCDRQPSSAD